MMKNNYDKKQIAKKNVRTKNCKFFQFKIFFAEKNILVKQIFSQKKTCQSRFFVGLNRTDWKSGDRQ